MNTQTLKGDWNVIKGTLKQKYATLTDDDLSFAEGKADVIIGNIQRRLGKTTEEASRIFNEATAPDNLDSMHSRPPLSEAQAQFNSAADAARNAAANVQDYAVNRFSEAQDKARKIASDVEQHVSAHPLQTLFTAFAAGLLMGTVLRR